MKKTAGKLLMTLLIPALLLSGCSAAEQLSGEKEVVEFPVVSAADISMIKTKPLDKDEEISLDESHFAEIAETMNEAEKDILVSFESSVQAAGRTYLVKLKDETGIFVWSGGDTDVVYADVSRGENHEIYRLVSTEFAILLLADV